MSESNPPPAEVEQVLLLTARDLLGAGDDAFPLRLAARTAQDGFEVTLVLLEDAVSVVRDGHRHAGVLSDAVEAGVRVLAEEDALQRRAVETLAGGVKTTRTAEVVDLLFDWADRQAWV